MKRKLITAAIVLLLSNSAMACYPAIKGTITAVSDGDTVTLKTIDNQLITIRLSDIDAPEKSHNGSVMQPYGDNSQKLLSALILNKPVTIDPHGLDIYGRTLGSIKYKQIDVNQYMVEKGAAWAYLAFLMDKSLIDTQAQAKAALLGLWALPNPIEPWKWRTMNKRKNRAKSEE